jgi:hypothetical protein
MKFVKWKGREELPCFLRFVPLNERSIRNKKVPESKTLRHCVTGKL